MKRSLLLSILAALPLAAVSCSGGDENVEAKVQIEPLTLKDTAVTVRYHFPATLRGEQDIAIYPQVTGRIMKVLVKEGQFVKADQVLFLIDDVPFVAAYEAAVADQEMAKAGVETAKLTYESKTNLYERKVISEYQLKLAYNDLLTAKAALAQADAKLKDATNDLSYCQVRTLIDGYVGDLPYKIGSLVSPSITTPLTIVSDNSNMYADFSIPESMYQDIRMEMMGKGVVRGQENFKFPLTMKLNNGEIYGHSGKMHSYSGLLAEDTGALRMRALFPNPDGILLSGGSCDIIFSQDEDSVVLIPRTAIKEIQNMMFVFKYVDGKLVQTSVNATRFDDTYWILLPSDDGTYPLQAGDIISKTTNRLRNDIEVELMQQ